MHGQQNIKIPFVSPMPSSMKIWQRLSRRYCAKDEHIYVRGFCKTFFFYLAKNAYN